MGWLILINITYFEFSYITDLQPLKDRLSELEDKIGTLEAENKNQTLKIRQLETELEMLQDRNNSNGNFNFLLSLFTQG